MKRILLGLPAVVWSGSCLWGMTNSGKRPNLLYIFPDQYRLTALSIWSTPEYRNLLSVEGDPVHTPNLDRLTREGVIFTQACSTSPLSSPNRAMMITGMFASCNGVDMNCHKGRKSGVPENVTGFTNVLAQNGYETAWVGKTHWNRNEPLFDAEGNYVGSREAPGGHYMNAFDTYIPEGSKRFGNKFWYQHFIDNHFDAVAYSNRPELIGGKKDGEPYWSHRFTTTVEADVVIRYLRNEHGERDASQPFSLFWAINPPHPPYSKISHCKKEVYEKYYKDLRLEDLLVKSNVAWGKGTKIESKEQLETIAKVYFSLIKSVDEEIGRVLTVLDEEGLADNTLVVFTSDHGEMLGSHGMMGKGVMYDESFLVPFILRYPHRLNPGVCDLMLGATDLMPTVLGLLGLGDKLPATAVGTDYSQGILNGFSQGEKPVSAPYLMKGEKGVRTERYSYWVTNKGEYMLFDNRKDPTQLHPLRLEDLALETVELLKSELGRWLRKADDPWFVAHNFPNLIAYPNSWQ